MTDQKAADIAALNDLFRSGFFIPSFGPRPVPGRIVCTSGVGSLPPETQICISGQVSRFASFTEDNDPHGEHDFGAFDADRHRIFFKIDYYDKALACHSPDPSDPSVTERVITIMLAEEY